MAEQVVLKRQKSFVFEWKGNERRENAVRRRHRFGDNGEPDVLMVAATPMVARPSSVSPRLPLLVHFFPPLRNLSPRRLTNLFFSPQR